MVGTVCALVKEVAGGVFDGQGLVFGTLQDVGDDAGFLDAFSQDELGGFAAGGAQALVDGPAPIEGFGHGRNRDAKPCVPYWPNFLYITTKAMMANSENGKADPMPRGAMAVRKMIAPMTPSLKRRPLLARNAETTS